MVITPSSNATNLALIIIRSNPIPSFPPFHLIPLFIRPIRPRPISQSQQAQMAQKAQKAQEAQEAQLPRPPSLPIRPPTLQKCPSTTFLTIKPCQIYHR